MNKYDELIGKLSLLVKGLEEKYVYEQTQYDETREKVEILKKEISEEEAEMASNHDVIKKLRNNKHIVWSWYKSNYWKFFIIHLNVYGLINVSFQLEKMALGIISFFGSLIITERIRVKESANEIALKNNYDYDDLEYMNEMLEKSICDKQIELNMLEESLEKSRGNCKKVETDLNSNKKLLEQIIGSRNLAYVISNNDMLKINKIYSNDAFAQKALAYALVRTR